MRSSVLKDGYVVMPERVEKSDVLIKDRRISSIRDGLLGDEIIDCSGHYVLPGFRDQHIHDINGFMKFPEDRKRLQKVSEALASQGVTSYIIATTAAPVQKLTSYLHNLNEYMNSERNGLDGARIEGANIEGTFIRRECAGAQPHEYIIPPNEDGAKEALKAFLETGAVNHVNIVADFGTDLIAYAASKGAIVGCGHCLATANQLTKGLESGLKYIVHLTNGAMGQSFKPFDGGGTYEGALTLPLFVELIIDGYHLDLRYVSDIIGRRVGQQRGHEIIAVTDGIFPIPEEIPEGEFRMFSTLCEKCSDDGVFVVKGRISEDGDVLPVPPNTLCSSKLTMNRVFENILDLLTVDFQGMMIDREALPLHEAIRYASMFTSSNQALMQGADETGSIDPGKLADLTILRIEGEPGKYNAQIEETMVAGKALNSS